MVLRFFLIAGVFLFMSCTEAERNNPDDPGGNNYTWGLLGTPSSSSVKPPPPSSSSRASSSSSKPSSSSAPSSSSSVALSSSGASSSSSKPSSSSVSTQAGIVYGADEIYQGVTYKTVKIGSQTWFQRNLNYAVEGSKCGVGGDGSSLSEANTTTCDTYGRLYDWATAMALPSKCNSKLSTSDADCAITTPHKGICPTGWHIPSDGDWDKLMTAVGGSSTAGKYLKATSGWNSGGNGVDKFGFAALPGGGGNSHGDFNYVGNNGYWWSASEFIALGAYYRSMYYDNEDVGRFSYDKRYSLLSVRCLQD